MYDINETSINDTYLTLSHTKIIHFTSSTTCAYDSLDAGLLTLPPTGGKWSIPTM